jgi:hypothetical protein
MAKSERRRGDAARFRAGASSFRDASCDAVVATSSTTGSSGTTREEAARRDRAGRFASPVGSKASAHASAAPNTRARSARVSSETRT